MCNWRKQASETLGFKSMNELAEKSGVPSGTLSWVCRGERGLTSENAYKLIAAIRNRKYQKGWDYTKSAVMLAEVITFMRLRHAHECNGNAQEITPSEIEEWVQYYLRNHIYPKIDYSDTLNNAELQYETDGILLSFLESFKSWNTRYDFSLLEKVQQMFHSNSSFLIDVVGDAMRKDDFYELVRDIYTEIRYISHLCGKCDFVKDLSIWLIQQSSLKKDLQTKVKAQITLSWILSNQREESSLKDAKRYLEASWSTIHESNILAVLALNDMDVVALLAELHLRFPIRLYETGLINIHDINFIQLMKESKCLLKMASQFCSSSKRLQTRYEIALFYQHGIYLYHLRDYESAIFQFEEILDDVDLIGWVRLEQAIYTWLATLYEILGKEEKVREILPLINVSYLIKRQAILSEIESRLGC